MAVIEVPDENAMEAVARIHARIKEAMSRLLEFEQKLSAMDERACKLADEQYAKMKVTLQSIQMRIDGLPILSFDDKGSIYQLKEFIKIAETVSCLDDKTWNRMLQIFKLYNQIETGEGEAPNGQGN